MRSTFRTFGHPIHPMLIPLPIGLFTWTLVADIIFLTTDLAVWYEIARWSGAAGVVTGLLAALPGFGDFLTVPIRGKARASATAHMLLNLTIVAAFAIAGYFMFFTDATDGTALVIVVALHAAGVGLLLISGWLGGELVYRYHIGIEPAEAVPEVRETR
jgi:uncharacterized membrane protein